MTVAFLPITQPMSSLRSGSCRSGNLYLVASIHQSFIHPSSFEKVAERRVPGAAYFYQARNQTESLVQTGSSDDRRKSPVELSFQEDAGAKIKISLDFF